MNTRVLLVDDNPEVTSGLKRALRKEPFTVLSAKSEKEVLDVL